jgi:DnaJ-class molecular chaperone
VILRKHQEAMAIKNYYVVLGVHREESATGIRAAYKDLAKRLHPDRMGEHGTRAFQEIAEAYRTLSDPKKRRLHNQLLDQELDRRNQAAQKVNVRRELEPEPLRWRKVSTMEDYQTARASFEDLYHGVFRSLSGIRLGLDFEVLLSADEARHGGVISVVVPAFHPCSVCEGSGRDGMFPCFDCRGLGWIDSERTVNIRFPPRVRSGTVIEVPLREFGIATRYLRLHLVVD